MNDMTLIGRGGGWELFESDPLVRICLELPKDGATTFAVHNGVLVLDVPAEMFRQITAEWRRVHGEPGRDFYWTLIEGVARAFRLSIERVIGERAGRTAQRARHVSWYLARKHGGLSYPEIARPFDMDHTAVLRAIRKIEQALAEGDTTWIEEITRVETDLDLPQDPTIGDPQAP